MEKAHIPLICITSGTSGPPGRSELYVKAVERAGGSARLVLPGISVSEISSEYDGLIIPGGADIDPALYNEKKMFKIRQEETQRTSFEFSFLKKIIKKRKPVLGICYGMQLLNVFFKGSLWQDLSLSPAKSLVHDKSLHGINIIENPFLEKGRFIVNSSHHQAIKNTGKGLRPFAYARDGIVEAFFLEDYGFLVGVQWHPERMNNSISKQVFRVFVDACKKNL